MKGYLLTFYTQQSRTHDGMSLADWIVEEARRLGIRGATLLFATEGFGHDGRFHSAGYFDLEDQPQQVTMAVSPGESERLFARLRENRLRVFYTSAPIDFGFTCDD
ncbi:protein of unknown function DUF190 [Desulfovibrio sp. X2]|uniref:DUF190 domain-containing protein n=1 Tax=Desulfovibrio sp. X2 TaxID=941449 RepID=UPI000358D22F|nr:DUF190 domain-containing protein [Desulfovibrio sp. X2]EPR43631.1 protein of unknown function DUF190 [Desulfovibrio sp. X2]